MTTISAKTILRSRNASAPDKVLSTLLLRYPRFIHAEFMTHRVFSRNAASSRAIPVKKMIDDILADTAMPLHWGAAQKGMQADLECNARLTFANMLTQSRESAWLKARDSAIETAEAYEAAGYHKQVVNRLLEPFMHITVLVSATEWDNFLELRDHRDAEPHIQILAREIRSCLDDESTVQTLQPGEWHTPFVKSDEVERDLLAPFVANSDTAGASITDDHIREMSIKKSVACCASTSYKTVDGFDMTLDRAIELHDKLVGSRPIHASPCEHVAQADNVWASDQRGWGFPEQHGNFIGFRQYRRQLELDA